jgi:hypothetical protein
VGKWKAAGIEVVIGQRKQKIAVDVKRRKGCRKIKI